MSKNKSRLLIKEQEGTKAVREGTRKCWCPYHKGTSYYKAWVRGWLSGVEQLFLTDEDIDVVHLHLRDSIVREAQGAPNFQQELEALQWLIKDAFNDLTNYLGVSKRTGYQLFHNLNLHPLALDKISNYKPQTEV